MAGARQPSNVATVLETREQAEFMRSTVDNEFEAPSRVWPSRTYMDLSILSILTSPAHGGGWTLGKVILKKSGDGDARDTGNPCSRAATKIERADGRQTKRRTSMDDNKYREDSCCESRNMDVRLRTEQAKASRYRCDERRV